jgi:hypothetical protein
MRTIVTVIVFALVAGAVAEPCCMVPADYKGTISQSAQEAVLFHADGREELILKINYKIAGEKMPDRFAWIITVPAEPDAYAVADTALFAQVFDWAEKLVAPPAAKGPARGEKLDDDKHGLEFGKAVKVGPYDIQPVRALGKEALDGLNAWLGKNGFPTEDPKHMEYFVEKKFTFLCVKVVPAEGRKEVDAGGGVPPLHLSFKSERPYYPLRFSSRQGVFDVNLYVLTKKPFDFEASGDSLRRINWAKSDLATNVAVKPEGFPKTLKDRYAASAFKDDAGEWRLNVLRTKQVNKDNTIATWKEDIFFATKG